MKPGSYSIGKIRGKEASVIIIEKEGTQKEKRIEAPATQWRAQLFIGKELRFEGFLNIYTGEIEAAENLAQPEREYVRDQILCICNDQQSSLELRYLEIVIVPGFGGKKLVRVDINPNCNESPPKEEAVILLDHANGDCTAEIEVGPKESFTESSSTSIHLNFGANFDCSFEVLVPKTNAIDIVASVIIQGNRYLNKRLLQPRFDLHSGSLGESARPRRSETLEVRIKRLQDSNKMDWNIYIDNQVRQRCTNTGPLTDVSSINCKDLEEMTNVFYEHMAILVEDPSSDWRRSVQHWGERFWKAAPNAFKDAYLSVRDAEKDENMTIQFYCDPPFVPWELMVPPESKDFWISWSLRVRRRRS